MELKLRPDFLLYLFGSLGALAFLLIFKGPIFLFILALPILLVWFLSRHLVFGWYVLVFLSPFISWVFRLSDYWYLLSDFPWLLAIYAPVVEFWAVFLFAGFVVAKIREWLKGEHSPLYLPGAKWFGLFLLSAVVSLINLPGGELFESIKYILHFIIFFYLAYVVLGVNIVQEKRTWKISLGVFAFTGFLGALMGFVSLFMNLWVGDGFHRAMPFAMNGWAPFGDQHIYLAEIITATLPIFLYFWYETKNTTVRSLLAFASVFVFVIGLLTLSRAGWITMMVEATAFIYLVRDRVDWKKYWQWMVASIFAFLPIFGYWVYFLFSSPTVTSSNSVRWYLTDMAWTFFREHPWIGMGAGSFITRVSEIKLFEIEFGAPVESHGFIQKILAEQGIIGMIFFTLFLAWIFSRVFARYFDERFTNEARLSSFASFFLVLSPIVFQLFNTQFYSSKMWVPIGLAIAQTFIYQKDRNILSVMFNFKLKKLQVITDL